jgi:polar amino acid transport system substrate-binding protein
MKLQTIIKTFVAVLFLFVFKGGHTAEKITVAFGEVLAPWILVDTNQGIIVDLIEAAMTPLGYEIEHLYLPYGRRTKAFRTGDIDIVSDMNMKTIHQYKLKGFFSDIAYSYENFAYSLHKKQYHFTQLNDLKNHSLLSWQDAEVHLGGEYAKMVSHHPRYAETFDQAIQVKMLFLERYEVIQLDAHIFDYYRAKLAKSDSIDVSQKVDRFALFGASPNGFLFKSEKMRDQFNKQLHLLKTTGQYQQIFERYM